MTAAALTEADWQQQLLELAYLFGWRHMHVRRSVGRGRQWTTATNVTGWPDLLMWHERQRRVLAVELKAEKGRTTPEQEQVLGSLAAAGIECHVWRPSDLDRAHHVLAGAA